MKWKDLSLKERKQIYDSVRANNPDATYFDIKEQFDSIPTYEDGKGKTINKADLPPEYRTGTPEYFERQKKVGRAIEGTDAYTAESYAEPFTPTITKKKKGKKVKTEADYDQEFAEVKRKYNNMQEYDKELSKITNDLFMPTDGSVETLERLIKLMVQIIRKLHLPLLFRIWLIEVSTLSINKCMIVLGILYMVELPVK